MPGLVALRGEEYCLAQQYESKVCEVYFKVQPIPKEEEKVPLIEQKMKGCSLKYHYLNIDTNDSPTNECVYQYLMKKYKPYIKSLSKAKLMELFEVTNSAEGIDTNQIIKFCNHYKISVYALDMEFKIFHQSTPEKRSHKYPALVYVLANSHLYPISEQTVRDSIFAISRSSNARCMVGYKSNKSKSTWNPELEVVMNPHFHQISDLENKNVVFTNRSNLRDLMVYFYREEQVIYESVKQNGAIVRIKYKNNVDIQINKDYNVSLKDCLSLSIPFKNQNQIQLALEIFDNFTSKDNIKSIFNSAVKDIFFNNNKLPFNHTYYVPNNDSNLTCIDIKKCFSSCISVKNEYPFLVYSVFDEVEAYQGKLVDGTFYVESSNFFPLRGNNWYLRAELEEAKVLGIDFNIKYQVIPSRTLPKDFFNELVLSVFDKCKTPKKIMNCLIR